MSSPAYDVAIIGAGDVGAAIARELARFDLGVALIDRGDVGAGTSKANTAILHTGFDCKPGTLEARLVARGHGLLLGYAQETGIPLERTGALLVAWSERAAREVPGDRGERPRERILADRPPVGHRAPRPRAASRPGRARRARGAR